MSQDEFDFNDDICRNYHGGNPESEEANLRANNNKSRDRRRIYLYLEANPDGASCDRIEVELGMPHQTASARCSELLRDGLVVRKPRIGGGYERTKTRTGSSAAILVRRPAT
jgi:hypothetical protein